MEDNQSIDGEARTRLTTLKGAIRQARELEDILPILDAVAIEIRCSVDSNRLMATDIQMIASHLTDSQLLLNELAYRILKSKQENETEQHAADLAEQCHEVENRIKELRNDLDLALRVN